MRTRTEAHALGSGYLHLRRRSMRLLLATTVLLAAGAGVAYATIPDSGVVFTACKLNTLGTIRLIDPSLPSTSLLSHCNATYETGITWNQKGIPGATGPVGPAGATGNTGAQGADSTVPGRTGAQGVKGDTGAQGATGPAGPSGATGAKGDTGSAGTNGTDGAPGAAGVPGAGFTWRGVYDSQVQYDAGDVVSDLGSAWIASVDIGGSQIGPPDSPWQLLAAKGNSGVAGANGTNGTNGTNGGQGLQGPIGPQGPPGPTGPPGTGPHVRWIRVNANATVDTSRSSDGIYTDVSHYNPGIYMVSLARPWDGCAAVASASGTTNIAANMTYAEFPNQGNENQITVRLWSGWDVLGNPNWQDGGFTLAVYCP
jgi:hypothetical protein